MDFHRNPLIFGNFTGETGGRDFWEIAWDRENTYTPQVDLEEIIINN